MMMDPSSKFTPLEYRGAANGLHPHHHHHFPPPPQPQFPPQLPSRDFPVTSSAGAVGIPPASGSSDSCGSEYLSFGEGPSPPLHLSQHPLDPHQFDQHPRDHNSLDQHPLDHHSLDQRPLDHHSLDQRHLDQHSLDQHHRDHHLDQHSLDQHHRDHHLDQHSLDQHHRDHHLDQHSLDQHHRDHHLDQHSLDQHHRDHHLDQHSLDSLDQRHLDQHPLDQHVVNGGIPGLPAQQQQQGNSRVSSAPNTQPLSESSDEFSGCEQYLSATSGFTDISDEFLRNMNLREVSGGVGLDGDARFKAAAAAAGAASKQVKDKTCLVCGDKALGYNFNAISCESCKAFFRRNAFKEIRGRCEGKCEVTVESRSYCKKCRLKKCFTIGMKKDLILNTDQKHQRRLKIHENRLKRQGLPYTTLPDDELSKSHDSPEGSASGSEVGGSLSHIIASEVDPEVLDALSEDAKHRIAVVMKAFRLSFDAPVNYDPKTQPTSTDFLNMADASVRRLVKMAKHLDTFQALHQEDQITLLKGAVVEVLIMRSSKMFDSGAMAWQLQSKEGDTRQVSAMGLQLGNGDNMHFFQQYQRFTTSLLSSTQRDNVVLMIMIVMTLFSPDRGQLQHKETVMQAQEEYAAILREYVEKRYPREKLMFAKILQKLADIREINETHTKMLTHMKVDELGPLIVEIFNLSAR